jgi:sulfatase maturation enzyme AslB (radical SAM superfamily)
MNSKRPLSINNGLVHGICNYHCRLCGIKKTDYTGPKEFQPLGVTEKLIDRVLEAVQQGIHIRYIANAGDGEPTLHPEFGERMTLFGKMLQDWQESAIPPPEISVVTNGSKLKEQNILEAVSANGLTLIISLPTLNPVSYGLIMADDDEQGRELLKTVLPGVEQAMEERATGRLRQLYFHISPPEVDLIRADFPATIDGLTRLAHNNKMEEINLILFPAPSNRTGLVTGSTSRTDMYRDLFRQYNDTTFNRVTVRMKLVLQRFFPSLSEIGDLLRHFIFPCLWNGNFFITPDGSSICCNDQSVQTIQGNILNDSIAALMTAKEQFKPGTSCRHCNQSPRHLRGSPEARIFSLLARLRMTCSRNMKNS